MTTSDREQACSSFLEDEGLAYIKVDNIEGVRTCILYDGLGDPIVLSEHGMVPLISYAITRDMTVLTVH